MNEIDEIVSDLREQVLFLRDIGVEGVGCALRGTTEDPEPEIRHTKLETYVPEKGELLSKPAPLGKTATPPAPRSGDFLESTKLSSLKARSADAGTLRSEAEAETVVPKVPQTSAANEEVEELLFGEETRTLLDSDESLEDIRSDIGADCTRCRLCEGRTQVVNSVGDPSAELMFVGEAPGADEDEQGEPFVGRAGQLLTKIIEAIDLKREDVFIGNINRCRPPSNRQPLADEADICKPFLLREIAVVRPKVIVVMGNTACQNLLGTKQGITRLRGTFTAYLGVKVMPTFHPAYLLRDPRKKREVWEDMKMVRDALNAGSDDGTGNQ